MEINNNRLLFQLPGLHCKRSCIFWLLPYFFGAVLQSCLRDCLLGLSPQLICQIKHNSQPLGCAFFFQSIVPPPRLYIHTYILYIFAYTHIYECIDLCLYACRYFLDTYVPRVRTQAQVQLDHRQLERDAEEADRGTQADRTPCSVCLLRSYPLTSYLSAPSKFLLNKHTDTRFHCLESCLCIHDCELAPGKETYLCFFFPGTWPMTPTLETYLCLMNIYENCHFN